MAASKKKTYETKSSEQIFEMLRVRYPAGEYAMFPEVRNSTGAVRSERFADAITMGLWPSRGLAISGFEFKSHRSDWRRELKHPAKAEPLWELCNEWWLVAGNPDVVKDGELPVGWGLIVAKGDKLHTITKAEYQKRPRDIPRKFVASLLRSAQAAAALPLNQMRNQIENETYEQHRKEIHDAEERVRHEVGHNYERLRDSVDDFEKASGVKIGPWDGERIGTAVKMLIDMGDAEKLAAIFERTANSHEAVAKKAREAVAELKR